MLFRRARACRVPSRPSRSRVRSSFMLVSSAAAESFPLAHVQHGEVREQPGVLDALIRSGPAASSVATARATSACASSRWPWASASDPCACRQSTFSGTERAVATRARRAPLPAYARLRRGALPRSACLHRVAFHFGEQRPDLSSGARCPPPFFNVDRFAVREPCVHVAPGHVDERVNPERRIVGVLAIEEPRPLVEQPAHRERLVRVAHRIQHQRRRNWPRLRRAAAARVPRRAGRARRSSAARQRR